MVEHSPKILASEEKATTITTRLEEGRENWFCAAWIERKGRQRELIVSCIGDNRER